MRAFIFVLALWSLPTYAWTGDDNCLSKIKNYVLEMNDEVPGLPPLKKEKIEFSRDYDPEDETTELSYELELTGSKFQIGVEYSIKPSLGEQQVYELERKVSVNEPSGKPILETTNVIGFNRECSATTLSYKTESYQSNSKGFSVVENINQDGFPAKKYKYQISHELMAPLIKYNKSKTVADLIASGFTGGRTIVFPIMNEGELMTTSVTFKEAKPLRRRNPIDWIIETLTGVEFDYGGMTIVAYTNSTDTFGVIHTIAGGQVSSEEQISKETWRAAKIEMTDPSMDVAGITNEDLFKDTLPFSISGKDRAPEWFNIDPYMAVENFEQNEKAWSIRGRLRVGPQPEALPVSAPAGAEDQRYLQFSKYIQREPVKKIVQDLRPKIAGLNRLEAAEKIIEAITAKVKYDMGAYNNGLVDLRTTADVLKDGKGVCQHYSAVFLSVARSLGIPARIVLGYLVGNSKAASHAWVEVKVNDKQWWPLEPQHVGKKLPHRGYIPISEYRFYEQNKNQAYASVLEMHLNIGRSFQPWIKTKMSKLSEVSSN